MPTDGRVDREVLRSAATFAARHLDKAAAPADHGDPRFPAEVFARAIEAGLDRLAVPEAAGGNGLDLATLCGVVQALSRACAGHAAAIGVHAAALGALAEVAGGGPIKEILDTGRPLGVALPDPVTVAEFHAALELERSAGGDAIVTGGPVTVVNASPAGFVLAFAKTGAGVPVAVLLETGGDLPLERTLGLRAMPLASPAFDRRPAPASRVVAEGTKALDLHQALLRNICLVSASAAAGVAGSVAEKALAYARDRRQGGRPIAGHSHLRGILGRISAEASGARGAAGHAAAEPGIATALAAMATVPRAALRACTAAVQVLGGYGYMREYGLEKAMRDAAVLTLLPVSDAAAELLLAGHESTRL